MSSRTTITESEADFELARPEQEGLAILVMSVEAFASFPLPSTGTVLIGRSSDCDVQLEDPLASRRHARLHLGATQEIEDLGSANGTRVRSALIEVGARVALAPGETVTIGSTVLVVRTDRRAPGVRRVWSHGWFEARLRDQCQRSQADERRFALVRLSLDRPTPWSQVLPLIDREVPPPHLFGAYGPHDYELLILDAEQDEATGMVAPIRDSLIAAGLDVRVGIACYPRQGRTADALMSRANAELRPAEELAAVVPRAEGASSAMQAVLEQARRAAKSNINVLIVGETGVGKEVMAQSLHEMSPRAGKPMLALNCAGLAEGLIESELFGHERGAFTGAVGAKRGLFEAANGGTLFLDEIGEMPASVQARVLRAIANREILPVGAVRPRAIDVRIMAATHRDLEAEVQRGTFRQDLFYRLNGMTLALPPLRERRAEIHGLVLTFIAAAVAGTERTAPTLTEPALQLLHDYDWPGNIRELKNIVERALVLSEGDVIGVEHLPAERMRAPGSTSPLSRVRTLPTLRRPLSSDEEEEKRRILQALEENVWNQSRTAKALGMPRRTFVSKLDRYNIPRPQKSPVADDDDRPSRPLSDD